MNEPRHYLIEGELALLRALEDQRWRTSSELADATGLAGFQVRGMLNALRSRRLVVAGNGWDTVGSWAIAEAGTQELLARRQMSLAEVPR